MICSMVNSAVPCAEANGSALNVCTCGAVALDVLAESLAGVVDAQEAAINAAPIAITKRDFSMLLFLIVRLADSLGVPAVPRLIVVSGHALQPALGSYLTVPQNAAHCTLVATSKYPLMLPNLHSNNHLLFRSGAVQMR